MLMRHTVPLATTEPVDISTPARQRIEAAIERHLDAAGALIVLLDRAERDPDGDCEPSIGWPEHFDQGAALRACRGPDAMTDCELDRADFEPSLGWTISGCMAGLEDIEIRHQPVARE
jgi:hypothetical protein